MLTPDERRIAAARQLRSEPVAVYVPELHPREVGQRALAPIEEGDLFEFEDRGDRDA